MKRVVFILLLVYASSILNVPELCAQKVQAGWVHVTTEKEKIEKEKKEKEKKERRIGISFRNERPEQYRGI